MLQSLADYCAGALERIRAEEELRASEKRYRILFDSNPGPVFVYDCQTLQIRAVNEAAIRVYGFSRGEFLAMSIKDIRSPEDQLRFEKDLESIRSDEKRFNIWRHRKKDGSLIDVEVTSLPVVFAEKPCRLSLIIDVTERKKLEKEILEISAREQRRIGHDLHDGLCQYLAGIGFLSQILTDKLSEKSSPEASDARKITDLINESVSKSRSLARGLFPVRLEENGLVSALEELAASTESLFLIQCHFGCDEDVLLRDNVRAQNLYYIAHEAVMNAVKHGKANNVWLRLETSDERGLLTVRDDGVGISEQGRPDGMGLRIMHYRAEMIGASVQVRRHAERGTVVSCSFPTPR
jgi:two-component system sensor kinase FixL